MIHLSPEPPCTSLFLATSWPSCTLLAAGCATTAVEGWSCTFVRVVVETVV